MTVNRFVALHTEILLCEDLSDKDFIAEIIKMQDASKYKNIIFETIKNYSKETKYINCIDRIEKLLLLK